jgi:hypothetical protein
MPGVGIVLAVLAAALIVATIIRFIDWTWFEDHPEK